MTDTSKPWVLLRKGKHVPRFETREAGMRFYDQLRFNRGTDTDAALFGPEGEAWYCRKFRSAQWERDDDRRRRERQTVDAEEPADG